MSLQYIDLVVVAAYLIGILIFGIWIGRREKADREGYFLGGRHFGWLLIGTSLFATNISSVQFVGQSGLAYKIGIAAANPQLAGGICLGLAAIFFIPIYLRTKIFTIPAFLEQRFNRQCKLIYCITMVATGLIGVPVMLYAGCLVVLQLFGLNESFLFISSLVLGLTVGVYAIVGGLSSVVYTDVVQSVILLIGGFAVVVLGIHEVGGLQALLAATPADHLDMILPPSDEEMPFTGVMTGLLFSSIFWAASNQDLLQRTLGAKDLRHAQLGMLLGAFLKIAAVFLLVFPGIIALDLVPGVNPDRAYPALVQAVLPVGISGIVLAGFIAALMSSLDSTLMSLSSVIAIEIYPQFDHEVSEKKALRVGRIAAGALLIWGIATAPFIKHMGLIYPLTMKTGGYLMSSIGVCYIVGRFSKRANAFGALITLVVGLVAGLVLVPWTSIPGLMKTAPSWLLDANLFHVSGVLTVIFTLTLLLGSRLAPPPPEEKLAFMRPASGTVAVLAAEAPRIGLLGSFPFWFAVYIACVVGVYAVF